MLTKSTLNVFILAVIVFYSVFDLLSFYNSPASNFALHLLYLIPTYYGLMTVSYQNLKSSIWINRLLCMMLFAVTINYASVISPIHIILISSLLALSFVIGSTKPKSLQALPQ